MAAIPPHSTLCPYTDQRHDGGKDDGGDGEGEGEGKSGGDGTPTTPHAPATVIWRSHTALVAEVRAGSYATFANGGKLRVERIPVDEYHRRQVRTRARRALQRYTSGTAPIEPYHILGADSIAFVNGVWGCEDITRELVWDFSTEGINDEFFWPGAYLRIHPQPGDILIAQRETQHWMIVVEVNEETGQPIVIDFYPEAFERYRDLEADLEAGRERDLGEDLKGDDARSGGQGWGMGSGQGCGTSYGYGYGHAGPAATRTSSPIHYASAHCMTGLERIHGPGVVGRSVLQVQGAVLYRVALGYHDVRRIIKNAELAHLLYIDERERRTNLMERKLKPVGMKVSVPHLLLTLARTRSTLARTRFALTLTLTLAISPQVRV